jgi:hypothetical protein
VGTYVEAELAQRVDTPAVLRHLQTTLVLARVELHHHLPSTITIDFTISLLIRPPALPFGF